MSIINKSFGKIFRYNSHSLKRSLSFLRDHWPNVERIISHCVIIKEKEIFDRGANI